MKPTELNGSIHVQAVPEFKSHPIPVTNETSPNVTADFAGFHISYNRQSIDYGCPTTALVIGNTLFFILNGDHKQALLDTGNKSGLQGCFEYFLEELDKGNHLSEHINVANGDNTFSLTDTAVKLLGQDNVDRLTAAMKK